MSNTISSIVRTFATANPPLACRNCSVTAAIICRGSPRVRTAQRIGKMRAFKRRHSVGHLRLRHNHHLSRIARQPAFMRVAHHADDHPRRLFELRPHAVADHDLLANRVLTWANSVSPELG